MRSPLSPLLTRNCLAILLSLGSLGWLTGCDRSEDSGSPTAAAPPKPDPAPTDELSKKIEAFTGAHTKLAWTRYIGSGSDVFANFDKLELWGLDTRDGKGVRPILQDTSNYARPIILPDGSGIIFSNKQTARKPSGKRAFDPIVYRVDWSGENLTEVASGYAVDVWRDRDTGKDWVYATDLRPTDRSSIEGTRLERFLLEDPSQRQIVWDKTHVGTENVQLSLDGQRASCLFPWPHAGVLDIEAMRHQKYQHGCWPSMAPDNSYLSWVFDGAHKNLHLFTDGAAETWVVPVNVAPGTDGHEVYHPRWSNHVRHFTMTGPYTGATVTRSDSSEVEVYIGRFSGDLREVEDWFQVTDDKFGDVFPDLWIDGGEKAKLDPVAINGGTPSTPTVAETAETAWPAAKEGPHHFLWKNRNTTNRVGDEDSRESYIEARESARFGPHYEMQTDGGFLEPDETSANAVLTQTSSGTPFTIEAVITPMKETQNGAIISASPFALRQDGNQLSLALPTDSPLSLGTVEASHPVHLALTYDGNQWQGYRDGQAVALEATASPPAGAGASSPEPALTFGLGWDGTIEGVAISPGVASSEAIAASAADWQNQIAQREPIPTVRVRGKLVEMTESRPVEALDTYPRGLLGYLYEVEDVLEGELDTERVMVIHWTILDRKPLSGFPRKIGESYELQLQPYAAHPQLVSERQWNDLFDPSDPWVDVATPQE